MLAKEINVVTLDTMFYNLLILINVCGTGAKDVVNFRITKYHMCISTNYIIHTVRQVSVQQCAEECMTLPHCSAVNYKRLYKLCELHSTFHDSFMGNAFTKGPCDFIKRSDISIQKSQLDSSRCSNEGNNNTNYCNRTYCPTLKLRRGAVLGNMHSVGSRVEYTCNKYFVETDGETHSTCQANGSWTHEPKCFRNFIYLGCYEDRQDRILYEDRMGRTSLTTYKCVKFCFDLDYEYALTQYKFQCFCGNTVRDYPKVEERECNTPCAGDPTEICGGAWRGSLYKRIQ